MRSLTGNGEYSGHSEAVPFSEPSRTASLECVVPGRRVDRTRHVPIPQLPFLGIEPVEVASRSSLIRHPAWRGDRMAHPAGASGRTE